MGCHRTVKTLRFYIDNIIHQAALWHATSSSSEIKDPETSCHNENQQTSSSCKARKYCSYIYRPRQTHSHTRNEPVNDQYAATTE
jgi:hypothetical protein